MVIFCQTALIKKDVSLARVKRIKQKTPWRQSNSSVVLNCNYSVINCTKSSLPPRGVLLKAQELWCAHVGAQCLLVALVCVPVCHRPVPRRPGCHPRAGCRRPALGQRHDGPVPAGAAGQVWPRGAALWPAGRAGCPRGGRVPAGQGHRCSAPGLAQGKDCSGQEALKPLAPLPALCVWGLHRNNSAATDLLL